MCGLEKDQWLGGKRQVMISLHRGHTYRTAVPAPGMGRHVEIVEPVVTDTIREVVAVFDDEKSLDEAVHALKECGFDSDAFSLLAGEKTIEAKLGHRYRRVKDVEDLPNVPRNAFISRAARLGEDYLPVPVLASIGALAFAFVNPVPTVVIAAGAGAALGALLGRISHENFVIQIEKQLARGGILLWVRVHGPKQRQQALDVLRSLSAHDVHAHEIEV